MKFSTKIIHWYKKNKRDLPWRKTKDPYKIWLSEVILQQTRIDQGLNYYLKFYDNYPNIKSLANASEEQVLKLWQGLGYYSRARNMHKTARIIVDEHDGQFPKSYQDVLNLKGVGEYTAAAIVSFAYNQVYPVVDGNVMRLLSRIYGINTPVNSTNGKKEIYSLASSLIDQKQAGEFNQAIMEFGALCCKPHQPGCIKCIFKAECKAYKNNWVEHIPVKINKIKIRKRYFHYFIFTYNKKIYLNKRILKDIWQNLYDFPHIESDHFYTKKQLTDKLVTKFKVSQNKSQIINTSKEYKHILTHQWIFARFYVVEILDNGSYQKINSLNNNQLTSIAEENIQQYPLPRLIDKYLIEN